MNHRDKSSDDLFEGSGLEHRPSLARRIVVITLTLIAIAIAILTCELATQGRANRPTPRSTESAAMLSTNRVTAHPLDIVFAGHSLTAAYFATTSEQGYRAQVIAGLEASGAVDATGLGQPGRTISFIKDTTTIPVGTGVVILEIGTNDVPRTSIEQISADYDAVMTKIRIAASKATIICRGAWWDSSGRAIFDPVIRDSCAKRGATFLSLGSIYDMSANRGPAGAAVYDGIRDNFHPNDRGHRLIAAAILNLFGIRSSK